MLILLKKIYWCADAWGEELKKRSKDENALVLDLLRDCEHRMINKIENIVTDLKSSLESIDADKHNAFREARTDFNLDIKRFLRNLVNFSLHLKKSPADSRKALGRKFLNNINGWLYRRKFSPKKQQTDTSHQFLYEGLLFPFSFENSCSSTLVSFVDPLDSKIDTFRNHLLRNKKTSPLQDRC